MNEKSAVLNGRHALVTGGASGIGAAITERLLAGGATVTVGARGRERLEAACERLGCRGVEMDVTSASSVQSAVEHARRKSGPIDILINNAGNAETAPFAKMSEELWDRMLAVNLTGTFRCAQAVVGDMLQLGFGRIVNIASTAALTGYPYVSAYCAAKHGVVGLTRALALEFARKGITVNAVCPGYTDTDLISRSLDRVVAKTGRSREAALEEFTRSNPQGRLVQPAEVADAVGWLCGIEAGSVTGQSIAVAGGEVM